MDINNLRNYFPNRNQFLKVRGKGVSVWGIAA